VAFLGALVLAWMGSKGGWKIFYASLFGASHSLTPPVLTSPTGRSAGISYYSGSLYDIPLAVSMAWITVIGLRTREREPQPGVRSTSTSHGVWLARLGMIAAFRSRFLPPGLCSMANSPAPSVRSAWS
jgi:hypothetical protein